MGIPFANSAETSRTVEYVRPPSSLVTTTGAGAALPRPGLIVVEARGVNIQLSPAGKDHPLGVDRHGGFLGEEGTWRGEDIPLEHNLLLVVGVARGCVLLVRGVGWRWPMLVGGGQG